MLLGLAVVHMAWPRCFSRRPVGLTGQLGVLTVSALRGRRVELPVPFEAEPGTGTSSLPQHPFCRCNLGSSPDLRSAKTAHPSAENVIKALRPF